MKKVFLIGAVVLFCTTVAWADAVDRDLPETATEQVKNSTRQMLNQGFSTENVTNLTRRMLTNNFREQQVLQAQAILMNARREGLPTEPIMNKAYEGLAKQVQAEAVVKAMEQVRSRYEFATRQAGAITEDKAGINRMAAVLAGSMAAGIHNEDAERIMQTLRERTRDMTQAHSQELAVQTLMTTQTMARLGTQSKTVGDSVCQALQQGYSSQEMHNMRNTVMANARHSHSGSFSMDHGFNEGQHGGPEGMGGHGADSDGGMGGGMGGGNDSGGGMGGGHM